MAVSERTEAELSRPRRSETRPSAPAAAAIELDGVIKIYRETDVETVALRGVDLTVAPGEFVAVIGRSGSGKSTLLNLVAGLDRPSAGRVMVDGVDVGRADEAARARIRGHVVGLVLQAANLLPYLSIQENVELAVRLVGGNASRADIERVLTDVGLSDRAKHRPGELSGGEQQRAALACVAATRPRIVLGDEVTGELDSRSAASVMRAIAALHASGLTVVLVTHDPSIAAEAQRIVELRDGRVVADTRR